MARTEPRMKTRIALALLIAGAVVFALGIFSANFGLVVIGLCLVCAALVLGG